MIRAVLDANAIVSGAARFGIGTSPPTQILELWLRGLFTLVISTPLLEEVTRTLAKPYFVTHVAPEVRSVILSGLRDDTIWTAISTAVTGVATHPEDDVILATAVSGKADFLVTGDKQLQRIGRYNGVVIVSPNDFLDVLNRQEDDER